MQDNYESPVQISAEEPWVEAGSINCTMTFDETDPCFVTWQQHGTGPYAERGAGTFFFTYRTSQSWDEDTDLFFIESAGRGNDAFSSGFQPGYSNATSDPTHWSTSIVKMQTGNPAGTVTLNSTDPRVAPNINFNYFMYRRDEDLQALAEGVEVLLDNFDAVGIPYTVQNPNPENDMKQSLMDEAFSHHAASTCRMGPVNSTETCVDSKFRVKGVQNLRVVDASIFPRIPGAFVNGPTFTVSRKALESILEDA
jgi:choline dehydrogenase